MEPIPRDRENNCSRNNYNAGAKAEDMLSVKSYYFKTEIFRMQELLKGKQSEIKGLVCEIDTEKFANRDKTFEAENLRKVLRETGDQLDVDGACYRKPATVVTRAIAWRVSLRSPICDAEAGAPSSWSLDFRRLTDPSS